MYARYVQEAKPRLLQVARQRHAPPRILACIALLLDMRETTTLRFVALALLFSSNALDTCNRSRVTRQRCPLFFGKRASFQAPARG